MIYLVDFATKYKSEVVSRELSLSISRVMLPWIIYRNDGLLEALHHKLYHSIYTPYEHKFYRC